MLVVMTTGSLGCLLCWRGEPPGNVERLVAVSSRGLNVSPAPIPPPPRELLRPCVSLVSLGERFCGVLPSDFGVLLDSLPLLRFDGVDELFCSSTLFLSDVLSSSELSLILSVLKLPALQLLRLSLGNVELLFRMS